ncbi:MAG: MotA/TolQ/ExbB proton channel family protein [Verrucomicrobiaceae bacterium]|nr:MotA/TolQ/ExbB proton channel family protein [Verrucomicrobiaceae bacterium]
MKKNLILLLTFLCANICIANSQLIDVAKRELEQAQREYSDALKKHNTLISEKQKQYNVVCAEIEKAKDLLLQLKRGAEAVSNLKDSRLFYKNLCSELSLELERISSKSIQPSTSSGEIYALMKSEMQNSFCQLSLATFPVTAFDVKTKERLQGKAFSVGGFKYFVSTEKSGFLSSANIVYGSKYAEEINSFIDGKSNTIPVDLSFGKLEKSERNATTFLEKVEKGGIWIYPILLLGVLSILVTVLKCIQLVVVSTKKSMANFNQEFLNTINDEMSVKQKEDLAFNFVCRKQVQLKCWIEVLSISAAVSPLLGLLGTVSGIIKTFAELSVASSKTNEISDGIAEALITTEYGLIVAIPALIANALLSRKIKKIVENLHISLFECVSSKK